MSEKQFSMTSNQMVAIILDAIGIILVLVGASIARAHSGEGGGLVIYWIGFVLLIVSLILFIWNMRKPKVDKA